VPAFDNAEKNCGDWMHKEGDIIRYLIKLEIP
jgi:hypothetical protein